MTSAKQIKFNIDGREVVADAGKTILDVARENGIEIPTLCHDPRLPPYGSCLVCVVEVEGMKKPILSCTTQPQEGMKVTTQSDALFSARKNALDMLLSNHYANCRGPCYDKCPADVDVQGYLALANQGRDKEALELIRETNPLPIVCGRVCVRYCEGACARNDIDTSPVAINFIKRYVSDLEHDNLDTPVVPPRNGKKVAIVGGGPGGLSAAYYLARAGTDVTIYDAHPKLGGMLRYGIPDYRLDQKLLDKEIQYILDFGVKVEANQRMGKDFELSDLKKQGYDAVFIALGAQKAKSMRVKNEETEGVVGGIEYLEEVVKEGPKDHKGHVLIVGGGNTAIDASRTALRSGPDKVSILYRRTRKEMPADDVEIEDAIEEGVNIDYLVAPLEVITDDQGKLKALRCQKMELGEPDASGRRRPVPVEGSEYDIECTMIIAAIGQDCDISSIRDSDYGKIEESRWATINADPLTFETNISGVFAGGDVVTGPEAAIDAIAHGRKAAEAMFDYLKLNDAPKVKKEFLSKLSNFGIPESYWDQFEKSERSKMRYKPVSERIKNFEEAEIGIDPAEVGKETARCISCGCSDVFTCELKKQATDYNCDQERFDGKVMRFDVDSSHPYINLDPNKCIVCGRCVRTCDDLQGITALGFVNRGFNMIVQPSMGKTLKETTCISCGNCIESCPTGAISFKLPFDKPGPWKTTEAESLCNFCSVGCNIVFNKTNDDMYFITGKGADQYTPGELCMRGRFIHRDILKNERLTEAQTKGGKTATIKEAVLEAAKGLNAIKAQHGADALGIFISPKATNEEIFLARKLGEALGTKNLTSAQEIAQQSYVNRLDPIFGTTASTASIKDVEEADAIIVVNSDIRRENPIFGFAVQRATRKGAKLYALSSKKNKTTALGTHLKTNASSNADVLKAIAEELAKKVDTSFAKKQEGFDAWLDGLRTSVDYAAQISGLKAEAIHDLVNLLADDSKNVVFIYNPESVIDKSTGDLETIGALLLLTHRIAKAKNGLLLTHLHANNQGHRDLLGNKNKPAAILDALETKAIKGVLIFGEDFVADNDIHQKMLSELDFLTVCDMFHTKSVELADVALPGSAYAESFGSVTSAERRVQSFKPVFDAPAKQSGFEVLAELYAEMTGENAPTIETIRAEIAKEVKSYAKLKDLKTGDSFVWNENGGGEILFADGFMTADKKAHFPIKEKAVSPTGHTGLAFSTIDRIVKEKRADMMR